MFTQEEINLLMQGLDSIGSLESANGHLAEVMTMMITARNPGERARVEEELAKIKVGEKAKRDVVNRRIIMLKAKVLTLNEQPAAKAEHVAQRPSWQEN